jgi:hypothetical protein
MLLTTLQVATHVFAFGYLEYVFGCGYILPILLASYSSRKKIEWTLVTLSALGAWLHTHDLQHLGFVVYILFDILYLFWPTCKKAEVAPIPVLRPYERDIRAYLFEHDPRILHQVDSMLEEYKGSEEELYNGIRMTYEAGDVFEFETRSRSALRLKYIEHLQNRASKQKATQGQPQGQNRLSSYFSGGSLRSWFSPSDSAGKNARNVSMSGRKMHPTSSDKVRNDMYNGTHSGHANAYNDYNNRSTSRLSTASNISVMSDVSDFSTQEKPYEREIRLLLEQYHPERLREIDSLLTKYRGAEHRLLDQLQRTYMVNTSVGTGTHSPQKLEKEHTDNGTGSGTGNGTIHENGTGSGTRFPKYASPNRHQRRNSTGTSIVTSGGVNGYHTDSGNRGTPFERYLHGVQGSTDSFPCGGGVADSDTGMPRYRRATVSKIWGLTEAEL